MKEIYPYEITVLHHALKFYVDFGKAHPETQELMQEQLFSAYEMCVTTAIYMNLEFYQKYRWFFNQWQKKVIR